MKDSKIYIQQIGQCENKAEYEQLVDENKALYVGWREFITPLMRKNRLTAKKVAEGCNISIASASSFARMIPSKRENVIMLCMMLKMTVEQTNSVLMRWAKFQKLYSKHPEDAIWIYLIEKGGISTPANTFSDYWNQYLSLSSNYRKNEEANILDTDVAFEVVKEFADKAETKSNSSFAESDEEFKKMIEELLPSFEKGYQKLMKLIDSYFVDIEELDDKLLGMDDLEQNHGLKKNTPNILFGNDKKWLDLYYRKIRELEKKHSIPSRTFLLALGLRLSLDTDKLNQLLEYAGMGSLCPKDRLEGSIVFYLEELYCQFPSFFNPHQLCVSSEFELKDYSPEYDAQIGGVVQKDGNFPDVTLDIDCYPDEHLSEYIKRRIEETNIFEKNEAKAVKKFLELL
nr:hypothetical protein [uncultured Anaerobutyricum sp.]